jgi:hypothetical protein
MRMHRRPTRAVLSALAATAAAATLALSTFGVPQAKAATAGGPIYLAWINIPAGTYSSDDTFNSYLPGCPSDDFVVDYIYQGTGAWNATAIENADGLNGIAAALPYYYFASFTSPTTLESTPWPADTQLPYSNVYVSGTSVSYSTTSDLVSGLGTGLYTLATACVDGTTTAPVLDSNGNPIAASIPAYLGTNYWVGP